VRFLVTAGPTREPIDPVRYLSNRSSGKMGFALAEAARDAGHEVVLISGPVHLAPPAGVALVAVTTSDEMYEAVHQCVSYDLYDICVLCAAVADFKPARPSSQKIKKRDAGLTLELQPTRDILASLGQRDRPFLLTGFAAETNDLEKNALTKLREKGCDAIVANDVSRPDSGMDSDENAVTIYFRDGSKHEILCASKKIVASELIKILTKMREKCLTKKS